MEAEKPRKTFVAPARRQFMLDAARMACGVGLLGLGIGLYAKQAKALPPLANPANKAQKLHVLEVIGHVYKANYRMRMLYAASPGPCLLMGQEILELSSF